MEPSIYVGESSRRGTKNTTQTINPTKMTHIMQNRSKLTRLVIDSAWDKKVWDDNWAEKRNEECMLGDEGENELLNISMKG
jgi:hypothetical protein